MRVVIPHNLERAEVRGRLKARSHEIADFVPIPLATVTTDWPEDDRMTLAVRGMGQTIAGAVEIGEREVVFTVELPPALAFVEPLLQGAIEQKGRKLLT